MRTLKTESHRCHSLSHIRKVGKRMNILREYTLREYADDEYKADLRKELEENGLYKSVSKRLDEINTITSELSYLEHRYVQEMMCEVLDLIELR